jgi:alpha-1,6-mannosyltransferase
MVTAVSGPARVLRWPQTTTAALVGFGALTVATYVFAVQPGTRAVLPLWDLLAVQAVLFGCSAWLVLTGRVTRVAFLVILAVAVLCRGLLVLGPLSFSSDVYRYVWDGRVQGAGINPYQYIPADPALARLRDTAIYPRINRRDYAHTIYPPLAEGIFLAVARVSQSVTAMKAAMTGFEAMTVWALCSLLGRLGMPRGRVLLYAWHPLILWQYAGDGHVDAAAVTFVVIALLARVRRWEALAGAALGCATLVKLYPLVLFPALYRRWDWKMPAALAATVAAGYLPYLRVGTAVIGFIPGYAREEGILSGDRFFLLDLARLAGAAVPAAVYIGAALLLLLAIGCRVLWEPQRTPVGDVRAGAVLATALVVLFSTHYLWYFGWLVAFLCVAPTAALFYLTAAVTVLYSAVAYRPFFGLRGEMPAFDVALYTPFALCLVGEALVRRFLPGRLGAGPSILPPGKPEPITERTEWRGGEEANGA